MSRKFVETVGCCLLLVGLMHNRSDGQSSPEIQPTRLAQSSTTSSLPISLANTAQFPNASLIAATSVDATLNSVAIVSADRLCAVGDRGAILLTEDAGHTWKMQPSVTPCNLHAVAFEGELGVAVGGWIGNVTNTSHGVVLRTIDGGQTWQTTSAFQLSRLTGVTVLGGRLIAWGDYSPELSASVFESTDGGLSWRGLPMEIGHAATVGISRSGALAAIDTLGRAAFSQNPSVKAVASRSNPLRSLLHTGKQWLACGDAGELLASVDGNQWTEVALPVSKEAREVLCLDAMANVAPLVEMPSQSQSREIWIGGSPGSILFHSSDGGLSWKVVHTGQALPIHDIVFLDPQRGWAVGAQGLILATRDGGSSWYAQRKHAARVGVLAAVSRHNEIPWCPLSACAWDEQVGAVAIVTSHEEPITRADFVPNQSTLLATIAPHIGLSEIRTWEVPEPEAAKRRLAIDLLTWRPDVALTNERRSNDLYSVNDPTIAMSDAISLAANAPSLPIAKELGLGSWQVTKFVTVTEPQSGQYSEQSRRVLRSPGLAIWDILLPLPTRARSKSDSVAMRTLWARSQATVVNASLFGGCTRSAENGRGLSLGTHGNYQLVMGRAHRQKSLAGLAEQPESEPIEAWSKQLNFVLDTFPASEAAPALMELAEQLSHTGYWERQRAVLETLAVRGSGSDAADWAKLTLLQLTSSDEFSAWKTNTLRTRDTARDSSLANIAVGLGTDSQLNQAAWNASPFESQQVDNSSNSSPAVVTASATTAKPPARVSLPRMADRDWLTLLDSACMTSPALRARANLKTLLAHKMLTMHDGLNHAEHLQSLGKASVLIGWNQIAKQELLLAAGQTQRVKWLATASQTDSPPVLDGQLDEAFWINATPILLSNLSDTVDSQSSAISWGFDENFLYIGIQCSRDPKRPTVALAKERNYDANLDGLDHVQLVLDTDRDYNTAIELAVAEDGQTYDRCCGIASFNPKWHVFLDAKQDHWTAEIAIKLSELTTAESPNDATWAMSARRFVPGREPQSWSQLRTHRPLLQGSGLLHFPSSE